MIEVKHPLEIGILADTKWGYKPCKNWDRNNTIHDGSLVFSKRGSSTICLTGHDGEEHETSIDLESQLGHSPTRSISTARCSRNLLTGDQRPVGHNGGQGWPEPWKSVVL